MSGGRSLALSSAKSAGAGMSSEGLVLFTSDDPSPPLWYLTINVVSPFLSYIVRQTTENIFIVVVHNKPKTADAEY